MKILVLPSWYPSKSYPNNGSFFKEQAEALMDSGAEVTVLCVDIPYRKTKKDFRYFRCNRYEEKGITVLRYVLPLAFLHRLPRLYYGFLSLFSKLLYTKVLSKLSFDAIHAHSFLIGGFLAVRLAKRMDCPAVITEHTSKILTGQLNGAEKSALKECVDNSDAFICVSHNLKNQVEKLTASTKTLLVYPNPVNPLFALGEKGKETFHFTSVGNLIPLKRMDLLIRAFCLAFEATEHVKLDIIGAGSEYETLMGLIKEENRENQIILHGLLSREEVAAKLAESHVFCLVSERETFGVSYIEGLAAGNVLIGTHNGGADDIIIKDNGMFVEQPTPQGVANVLRQVYACYESYSPDRISQQALEQYGQAQFGQFYCRVLSGDCHGGRIGHFTDPA